MQRYFLELMYKGAHYSGFQVQENAPTVQAAVEKAFLVLQKLPVALTGSSRTDAGVHARQNFFHFDFEPALHPQFLYKMNAILPKDIVIKNIYRVPAEAHCRFDAIARSYRYYVYQRKDPFLEDRAYFFPFTIDIEKMREAAAVITEYSDFTSFSKRNTQARTAICAIAQSEWLQENGQLVYAIKGDRFLRGMVRGITGTMLQVGRGKLSIGDFRKVIEAKDCSRADFAVPGYGLFLQEVSYPPGLLK